MRKIVYFTFFCLLVASCATNAKDPDDSQEHRKLPFKVKFIPSDIKQKLLGGKNVLLMGIDENGEVFVFTDNRKNLKKRPTIAKKKTRIGKNGGTFFSFDVTVVTSSPNCYRLGGNPVVWWPFDSDCPHE